MVKKILGIVGSPRKKGNTNLLVEEVLKGAEAAGAEKKLINLYDYEIRPCVACDGCMETKKCVVDDGMTRIQGLLEDADVIVFGTPVYWWGPSAQFKAFMDRWYNPGVREKIAGKKVIIGISMGDGEPATAAHTAGMLNDALDYIGTDIVATVIAMNNYNLGDILKDDDVMEKAYKAGEKSVE